MQNSKILTILIEKNLRKIELVHFYADTILRFVNGKDYIDFENDLQLHFATAFALTQIDIEMERLSSDFYEDHFGSGLEQFATVCYQLIHEYDEIEKITIWDAVQKYIPSLLKQCTEILRSEGRVL